MIVYLFQLLCVCLLAFDLLWADHWLWLFCSDCCCAAFLIAVLVVGFVVLVVSWFWIYCGLFVVCLYEVGCLMGACVWVVWISLWWVGCVGWLGVVLF